MYGSVAGDWGATHRFLLGIVLLVFAVIVVALWRFTTKLKKEEAARRKTCPTRSIAEKPETGDDTHAWSDIFGVIIFR
jgi:hypothetical protein